MDPSGHQVESFQFSEHGASQPAVTSSARPLDNQNNEQADQSPGIESQNEFSDDPEVVAVSKIGLAMLTFGLCLCTLVVSLDITILGWLHSSHLI